MLVLHPSSRCDVCLEAYTWETPAQTPHAIPCGHIFCKTCLRAVTPSHCPLCRKLFNADRAKKLHVDRPENVEELRDFDLLERLALAWDTPEGHLVELTDEVETWLQTRADDSSTPLRKAREALGKYQKLKEKSDQDRRKIKTLEHALRRRERDRDTTKAVEESLLSRVQSLDSQLEKSQSEVEELRSQLARYQHTSNPLPPPPQPIPLDRFPAFARVAASLSSSASTSNGARFLASDGTELDPLPADVYVDGYPPYLFGNHLDTLGTPRLELSGRGESEPRGREAAASRRRKGKQPAYDIYRNPSAQDDISGDRQRNGIIPGASPNQRVIPPRTAMNGESRLGGIDMLTPRDSGALSRKDYGLDDTDILDPGSNEVEDPSAPAVAYVSGYVNGYGYGLEHSRTYSPPLGAQNQPTDPERTRSRERGLGNMGSLASALPVNQEPGMSSLGLVGVPPPPLADFIPGQEPVLERPGPSSAPAALTSSFSAERRRRPRDSDAATRTRRSATSGHSTTHVSRHSNPGQRRTRDRSAQELNSGSDDVRTAGDERSVAEPTRTVTERTSVSSWGTVYGDVRNPHDSTGSMSDLGLRGFPSEAALWASVSSDVTPTVLSGAFLSSERRVDDINASGFNTPRMASSGALGPTEMAHLLGIDPSTQTSDNRPRYGQVSSYPASTTQSISVSPDAIETHTIVIAEDRPFYQRFSSVPELPTQTATRHDRPRAGQSQSSSSVAPRRDTGDQAVGDPSLASDVTAIGGYLTESPPHLTSNPGNALGLELSQTPEPSGLQITAPTPMTSTRNFLRYHSYDSSR